MFVNDKQRQKNIYDSLIKYETKHLQKFTKLNGLTGRNLTLLLDHKDVIIRVIELLKAVLTLGSIARLPEKKESFTQTEHIMLYDDKCEQEKNEIETAYYNLKREYNSVYIEFENLRGEYTKIVKEKEELDERYRYINEKYEKMLVEFEDTRKVYRKQTEENEVLAHKLEDERLLVENFEKHSEVYENLGKTLDSLKSTKYLLNFENLMIKNDKILSVCKFLPPLEIINLKHASKRLYSHIDSHTSLSKFLFYSIIKRKNKAINQLKLELPEDDIVEHEEDEIETLLRKHRTDEDKQYKEYGVSIMNAVEFVCNDIKIQAKRTDKTKDNSYIKGVTSLFSGLFNNAQNNFNGYIGRNGHSSFSTTGKTPSNLSFSDMVKFYNIRVCLS
jgi:hypothetical protein